MALPVAAAGAAAAAFMAQLTAALGSVAIALKSAEVVLTTIDPTEELTATRALKIYNEHLFSLDDKAEGWAVRWAAAKAGLDLDPDKPLNGYTLTQAINNGVLKDTGLSFTNLLDGEAIKRDLRRIALQYVGETIGIKGVGTPHDLVQGMRGYASEYILSNKDALAALGIKPSAEMIRLIKDYQNGSKWNEPRDFTKDGISNRARQAKYRQRHAKKWIAR